MVAVTMAKPVCLNKTTEDTKIKTDFFELWFAEQ
jgi:hypothetical protein